MKRPTESDFEASDRGGAIEIRFKPTKSSFIYYRLADSHDVATVGAVAWTQPYDTGGLGDYSAHSHEVYEMARRAALKHAG
jgi:hypothetical protein